MGWLGSAGLYGGWSEVSHVPANRSTVLPTGHRAQRTPFAVDYGRFDDAVAGDDACRKKFSIAAGFGHIAERRQVPAGLAMVSRLTFECHLQPFLNLAEPDVISEWPRWPGVNPLFAFLTRKPDRVDGTNSPECEHPEVLKRVA